MSESIRDTIANLCLFKEGRNHLVQGSLENARTIIENSLLESGCPINKDFWIVDGIERINITGSLGIENEHRIVIGAHYDTVFGSPGADDNASSVAVMLMVAKLLKDRKLNKRIDFVAFDTEEPPFFMKGAMGSKVCAQRYKCENNKVDFMVCLEMLGFYIDAPLQDTVVMDSQLLDIFDKVFYASGRGDFLSIVWQKQDSVCSHFNALLEENIRIPVLSKELDCTASPLQFCDARNFIDIGVPTILLSDTGMIRNPNYHRATDTLDTLNYGHLELIAEGLASALAVMAGY